MRWRWSYQLRWRLRFSVEVAIEIAVRISVWISAWGEGAHEVVAQLDHHRPDLRPRLRLQRAAQPDGSQGSEPQVRRRRALSWDVGTRHSRPCLEYARSHLQQPVAVATALSRLSCVHVQLPPQRLLRRGLLRGTGPRGAWLASHRARAAERW